MKVTRFTFSLFGINTYVVSDPATKACAIIDPGMLAPEENEAMTRFIEREGLKVEHLINTHMHIDHVAGNSFVTDRYGVPVSGHVKDATLAERVEMQAQQFGLPPVVHSFKIDVPLTEGDVIKIGEGSLKVLHVPGHSPGSIVLYDEADGFLIAGDVLFRGSIGRTDLPGGDFDTLISGITTKLMTLPGDTVVYPGHGEPTTIAHERSSNPFIR